MSGGRKHTTTVLDVRDSKAVDAWIAKTVTDHGRLDGAANIAGVFINNTRLVDETDEGFAFQLNVNTIGLFYCLRAQLKVMKPGGSIVSFHHVFYAILVVVATLKAAAIYTERCDAN
jgi:NAD(P)-dependent dehydrogenase (short-subunit alcohol dehydrogenase family)